MEAVLGLALAYRMFDVVCLAASDDYAWCLSLQNTLMVFSNLSFV